MSEICYDMTKAGCIKMSHKVSIVIEKDEDGYYACDRKGNYNDNLRGSGCLNSRGVPSGSRIDAPERWI